MLLISKNFLWPGLERNFNNFRHHWRSWKFEVLCNNNNPFFWWKIHMKMPLSDSSRLENNVGVAARKKKKSVALEKLNNWSTFAIFSDRVFLFTSNCRTSSHVSRGLSWRCCIFVCLTSIFDCHQICWEKNNLWCCTKKRNYSYFHQSRKVVLLELTFPNVERRKSAKNGQKQTQS